MKLKFLCNFFATSLYAGIEPSSFHPFLPEISQLGAVGDGLNSSLDRVNTYRSSPP